MLVVFDTNVWVSAMHFNRRQSAPVRALERARVRDTFAVCPEIEEEVSRILVERFHWQAEAVRFRLNYLLLRAVRVEIRGSVQVCRDPNDDMVLECAVAAEAPVIVSGDKDLLTIGAYEGVRIVSPAEFLALVE